MMTKILNNMEYILLIILSLIAIISHKHLEFAIFFTGALLIQTIKQTTEKRKRR